MSAVASRFNAAGVLCERHVLAAMVWAGNLDRPFPLGKEPAYSYQILVSDDCYVIFREHMPDRRLEHSFGRVTELFEMTAIAIVETAAFRLDPAEFQPRHLCSCGSLVGVIEDNADDQRWQIAFPLNHATFSASAHGPLLQVETGPVPLPSRWFDIDSAGKTPPFECAFLFWRVHHGIEFQAATRRDKRQPDGVARCERRTSSVEIFSVEPIR